MQKKLKEVKGFSIVELDDERLVNVTAGLPDINFHCPNDNCAGANCVTGCGGD